MEILANPSEKPNKIGDENVQNPELIYPSWNSQFLNPWKQAVSRPKGKGDHLPVLLV